MRIQPTGPFQPASASSSTTRIQLAAKDNSQSSIDQKTEGCFSSLWNSFVSVLSSIWNFFTGCCKAKQKETSTEVDEVDPIEEVSFKLEPETLIKHLNTFAQDADKKITKKIQANDHGKLRFKKVVYWIQINQEKHLISQISFTDTKAETTIQNQLKILNTNALKLDDVSQFSMHALLMEWRAGEIPYQYTYVDSTASVKGSSEELELSFTTTDQTSEPLSEIDARSYINTFFSEDEPESKTRDILKKYIS